MDYNKGSLSTTVGFDYGILLWDATLNRIYRRNQLDDINPMNEIWRVTVTGTPGQIAFTQVRKALLRGKDGVILVIDGTQPSHLVYAVEQYHEAREVLGPDLPVMIFSNKHDLPQAKDLRDLISLVGIKAEVEKISALKGRNVERRFVAFLNKVRKNLLMKSIGRIMEGRLI